jgi:hypothetical protein
MRWLLEHLGLRQLALGNAALLAYLATLVWTGIAIVATSRIARPRHRPGAVSETR